MAESPEVAIQAQVDLLKQLFDTGVIDADTYRAQLETLGVGLPPAHDMTALRKRLDRLDDPQLEALVLEAVPEVKGRFSRGMYRDEKVTLLLDHVRRHPGAEAAVAHALDALPETCDPNDALAYYLNHVIEANRRLPLQGIRSASGLVTIPLEEIYITLTATVRKTVREEEALLEEMARLAPGEARRHGLERPTESVQQVKAQVQEALALHPRLVVLGDPGSGKTTLLSYLALSFARDLAAEPSPDRGEPEGGLVGLVRKRLQLDEHRLPILLPLREFARYLARTHPDQGTDGPMLLLDYLRTYFANQEVILPPRFFLDHLQTGECVVLLDGVDEVAMMPARQRIARIIEKFTLAYPDNRYVVTSRIVGYTGGAQLGADYAITTVRDFTDDDIARFIQHWNLAVEIAMAGEDTAYVRRIAEHRSTELLDGIRSNERIRELTVNPLLLTVVALVQHYRTPLPERRVELYEEAIEVLLAQWEAVKGLPDAAELEGLRLDAGDRRSLLEPVALWMMEQHTREIELDDLRRQLAVPFSAMLSKHWRRVEKAVDGFLQVINARSGLITERGPGIYAFSHLTFQEHLAARAVADREDYVTYTLSRMSDSWWREVVLLEAGYLSTQGKRRVTDLMRAIMDHTQEPEPDHNLVLAAEALRDVGQARTEGDLASEVQRRLRRAYEAPLRKSADLPALIRRRAAASEALGRIEGGIFGTQPAFWSLPYGIPIWVEIPAGAFWMGGEGKSDGKPGHPVELRRYWISRVPITNAQYRIFVAEADHRLPGHWEDGRVPRGFENHPVVNVSWRDALAYCGWLQERVKAEGGRLQVWEDGRRRTARVELGAFQVTLPSEAEWEKAARGDKDRRAYPWGEDWREGHCNTDELGLNETSPVGVFPEGASPYGTLEMAGNVWEWTRSAYGGYPYDPQDGREDLNQGDEVHLVLRGGAFYRDRYRARCAARGWGDPYYRNRNLGFRVVVSPSPGP